MWRRRCVWPVSKRLGSVVGAASVLFDHTFFAVVTLQPSGSRCNTLNLLCAFALHLEAALLPRERLDWA